jgi:hypothetical protein
MKNKILKTAKETVKRGGGVVLQEIWRIKGKLSGRVSRRKSWLTVMKACPLPMDDLPPRNREMPKKVKL